MLSRPVCRRRELPLSGHDCCCPHAASDAYAHDVPSVCVVRWKRGEVCMMTTLVLTNEGEHCAQAFLRERARMVAAEPFVATGR